MCVTRTTWNVYPLLPLAFKGDIIDPMISCPPTVVRYARISSQHLTVSWPAPTAVDDSGNPPNITSTPHYPSPSGTFGVGEHTIVYTARDGAGNQASCSVRIDIICKCMHVRHVNLLRCFVIYTHTSSRGIPTFEV